jgi:hypothetical protein
MAASPPPGTASPLPDNRARNRVKARAPRAGKRRAISSSRVADAKGHPEPKPPTSFEAQENVMNRKHYTLIGAAIGLATFLALGLLPALLYGGYAGVLLAGGIFGTPLQATLLVRGLIVFGMVLGVVGVGALFAVGGAVAGAAVSLLTGAAPEHRTVEVKAGA